MKINTQRGIAPLVIILLVLALGGGGAYALKANSAKKAAKMEEKLSGNATSTVTTATTTAATSSAKTLQITLNEQNKSGQSGKVVITEVNGKAKVLLNLTGKPSGVAQPAHIHLGSCATIGAVKYPLTSVATGTSQTMLDVSVDQLLAGLPLSINVHKSAAEASVYVACGDISTSTKKDIKDATATTSAKTKVDASVDVKVR